jgi:hypothetical protein
VKDLDKTGGIALGHTTETAVWSRYEPHATRITDTRSSTAVRDEQSVRSQPVHSAHTSAIH